MRLYRALLHVYPASFRHEYGGEMSAIFARRLREAGGPLAVLLLWLATIADAIASASAVHIDILRQDLRYTARSLGRSKGFAVTAILVVGLGIGATTAVFSVTDFVLIRPLPFPRADRLVILWERHPGYGRMELSPANYRDWKQSATVFSKMAAFTFTAANLTGAGEPRRLLGTEVAADFLPTLGVPPLLGRGFTPSDDAPGAPGTIILTYRLWQTEFGGSPDIIGRTVALDEVPHTVIGVMPNTFHYPSEDTEFWTPIRMSPQWFVDRNDNFLSAIARLGDGVTIEQARAEGDLIAAQLTRQYATDNAHTGLRVNTWREEMPQQTTLLLTALGAAALCVLLIVCANLASLLLTRALSRRQELAIRTAMGAGRERLVRQLMTESVVLAAAGGVVGVLVGAAAVPLLMRIVPASLPLAAAPHVDLRVLAFAGVLTLVTGVGFGMLPVVRASRRDDLGGLRDTARAGGGKKERLRAGLVVAEIVASIVLLVSAGLLLRALWRVQAIDPGFQVDNVLTMRTALPMPRYASTAARRTFYANVLDGVRALPGVESAAYISFAPMTFGGGIFPVSTNGQPRLDRSDGSNASLRFVTPGFFQTLDIPVVQGRDVAESDTADRQFVAVVSESFAKQFLADGATPIGRRFDFAFRQVTVVGVVGDVHTRGLEKESEPQVYLPYLQQVPDGALVFYAPKDLIVRSSVGPEGLLPSIRAIVRKADPGQPLSNVRTMAETVAKDTASRAAQLRVLGAFALVALLLAAIGIHGVLSFAVSQRTQEIGVRIALGAQRRDILGWVLGRGAVLALAGVVPGIALAYVAGRLLEALLAGVTPGDAATFATAVALAVVMTLAGSLVPTLRAVRVDPIRAIRQD